MCVARKAENNNSSRILDLILTLREVQCFRLTFGLKELHLMLNVRSNTSSQTKGYDPVLIPSLHPWGKEIQVCSIEVPRIIYGPTLGLNVYIVIYRDM